MNINFLCAAKNEKKKPIHSPIAKKYDIVLVLFVEKCFYQEYVLECDHRWETSRRHTESGVYF